MRSAIPICSRSRRSSQAGSNAFETSPSLQAARAQRVEQRVRRRADHPGRLPGGVLGLEEPIELLVGDLDPEVPEHLAG